MAVSIICSKCGNVFRARKGLGSKCPKCQTQVDRQPFEMAFIMIFLVIGLYFILAVTGVITWDQFQNGKR